jgi:hypothetical protein
MAALRHNQPLASSQLLNPNVTLTVRFDRPLQLAREQNNSSFRAQGRLDALDQPLAHVRPPPEQEETRGRPANRLHRRPRNCRPMAQFLVRDEFAL